MYTLSRIGFYAPLSSWLLPLLYRGMVVSPNLIFRNSVKRFQRAADELTGTKIPGVIDFVR